MQVKDMEINSLKTIHAVHTAWVPLPHIHFKAGIVRYLVLT